MYLSLSTPTSTPLKKTINDSAWSVFSLITNKISRLQITQSQLIAGFMLNHLMH